MPALAVSARLRRRGADILYVGSQAPLDRRLVEADGLPFVAIVTGKLRRYFAWQNFIDPFKVAYGFLQSLRILRRFKPDVVFGKGGFVTVPVIRAARLLRIPVVLHESDARPGLSNRLGAKTASVIAVSHPTETISGLPAAKLVFTGNPIKPETISGKAANARRTFKLEPQTPLLLVVGGSQGAQPLNRVVLEALPHLLDEFQVVHQVGNRNVDEIIAAQEGLSAAARKRYHVRGYLEDPDLFDLYAAADLIVARAGAGLTANVAAVGKPAILVPLPAAVSDHQEKNAAYFTERDAAVSVRQEDLTGEGLARLAKQLLHNPQRRAELGRNVRKLATLDAAEKVAELIWQTGRGRE